MTIVLAVLLWVGATTQKGQIKTAEMGVAMELVAANQNTMRERLDTLALDRYTATQAAVDRNRLNADMNDIREALNAVKDRVRAVEREIDSSNNERN